MILKFVAVQRGIWNRACQDPSFETSHRRPGLAQIAANGESPLYFIQERMTQRARDSVFRRCFEGGSVESLVEVIRQQFFELRAVNQILLGIRHTSLNPLFGRRFPYRHLCSFLNRHHAHPSEYLRELDTPAVDSRFDRALGYLQDVDDLLIRQLLDVAKYHASFQIRR